MPHALYSQYKWSGSRKIGVPGGNRTPDNRFRKPVLYPAELRAHNIKITQDMRFGVTRETADIQEKYHENT